MPPELTDSSELLRQPEQLKLRLGEQGYLFFRGYLDAGAVSGLGEAVAEVLERHGWARREPGLVRALAPHLPGDPGYWPCYTAVQRLEALHRLAHHESLLAVTGALAGDDVLVHPRKMVRIGFPSADNPEARTAAHQDYPYVQGGVDGFTCWIPLAPTPRQLGGLEVLAGSARTGIRPIRGGDQRYRCAVAHVDGDEGPWLSTDYQVGDLLLFHSLTVHGSLPNLTPGVRLSVDFRYRSVHVPISEDETLPAWYPKVPAWETLSAAWSSKGWVELPAGATVVPVEPLERGVGVPASPLLGTSAGVVRAAG